MLNSRVGVLWYYVTWGTFKVPSHCRVWKGKFGKMFSLQCSLATIHNCWFLQNQVFCSGWGHSCFISEVQPQFCWASAKKSCSSNPGSLACGIRVIMVSEWPLSHTVLFQGKGSLLFIPSYLGPDLGNGESPSCVSHTDITIFTLTTWNSFLWPFELLYLELPPRFSLFLHHPPFCSSVGFCIYYFLIHRKVSPLILSVAKCLLQ